MEVHLSEGADSMEEYEASSEFDSADETETAGNFGWADAMQKVLRTKVHGKKNFILSKAKKDYQYKEEKKDKIEMVDEAGRIIKDESLVTDKILHKEKHEESSKKRQKKLAWESMGRVKPDVKKKEREKELNRIATKGVVHLFNTVEKYQKSLKKNPKEKSKEKVSKIKGSFMDILKSHSKMGQMVESANKKMEEEETWSILKDDFMMGAEMKDWDKESDTEK